MSCWNHAPHWHQSALALLLGAASPLAVAAEPAPLEWALSADVRHRTLRETAANGARLLTEEGAIPRLRLSAQTADPRLAALLMEASWGEGQLDYEGQTQTGVPLSTTSRHTDREVALHWRPLPAATWGEAWVGLGWLWFRRGIASTPTAGGLTETSSLVLPGIRWRSPEFSITPAVPLRLEAQWRTSVRHRLVVDYRGVFDDSAFRGGRRHETILRLAFVPAQSWQGSLEWSHTRQAASEVVPLYRAGGRVGNVQQPRLRINDLSISFTRRF